MLWHTSCTLWRMRMRTNGWCTVATSIGQSVWRYLCAHKPASAFRQVYRPRLLSGDSPISSVPNSALPGTWAEFPWRLLRWFEFRLMYTYSRVDYSTIYMQRMWWCEWMRQPNNVKLIGRWILFWSLPCLPLPSYADPFGAHANRVRCCPGSFPLRAGPASTSLASKVNSRQQSRKHVMRQVFRSDILPTRKHSMGGDDTTIRHSDGLSTWLLARLDSTHPFLCLASRNQIWPSASLNCWKLCRVQHKIRTRRHQVEGRPRKERTFVRAVWCRNRRPSGLPRVALREGAALP